MNTTTQPATEAVAKPVPSREIPPAGYRIFSTEEKWRLQIPDGALFFYESVGDWVPSVCIGQMAAHGQDYAVPISAQPTPSGPTGDSMDVHYEVLKAENEALRAALGIEPDWTVPKQTPQFGSILVDRAGGRARISPATDNEQALAHALAAAEQERNKAVEFAKESDNGKWQRMKVAENESDDLRAELEKVRKTAVELVTAAETMEEALRQIASMEPAQHSATCMLMHQIANKALPPAPSVASEKEGK